MSNSDATRQPPFSEQTNDPQLDRIQSRIQAVRDALNARGPQPVDLTATFTAGQVRVLEHGLLRTPESWSVIDVTGGYGAFKRTAWSSKTITIQSQNACTATFRVA